MKNNNEICECGHHRNYHLKKGKISRALYKCSFMSEDEDCFCEKFKTQSPESLNTNDGEAIASGGSTPPRDTLPPNLKRIGYP